MVIVLCNVPPELADAFARGLVEARLAACVNALPVRSTYRWDGETCVDAEVALWIKTREDRVEALRAWIREAHPYALPEIVVLPVDADRSLPEYMSWVRSSAAPPEAP